MRIAGKHHKGASVYVHKDDCPWLLEYMHEELLCAGVPGLADVGEHDSQDTASSDGVAAVAAKYRLEWNFQERQWEATFLLGELQGQKARCDPAAFTEEKYKRAMAGDASAVPWADACRETRREAMRRFLEQNVQDALSANVAAGH